MSSISQSEEDIENMIEDQLESEQQSQNSTFPLHLINRFIRTRLDLNHGEPHAYDTK